MLVLARKPGEWIVLQIGQTEIWLKAIEWDAR
jgi:hypothetical protein